MLVNRKSHNKKTSNVHLTAPQSLGASLTSIEWLTDMQIGKPSTSLPTPPSSNDKTPIITQTALPITLSIAEVHEKLEPTEVELPTSTVHAKPPYSYVNLIRQAILSTTLQRMTLNEIYQWIVDTYPYFRTAPPKWKNSIRHNLSLNKCFRRLQRSTDDPGKGSYWAVVDCASSADSSAVSTTTTMNVNRKRKFDDMQTPMNILPTSPESTYSSCTVFSTNKNPMICGDLPTLSGGRTVTTDKSNSTTSLVSNSTLLTSDDLNLDLTSSSFRRIYEPIFDASISTWLPTTDISSTSPTRTNVWSYETNPSNEHYHFPETTNVSSTGEIHLNDFHFDPHSHHRRSSVIQQDDRTSFVPLNSSLSSIIDWPNGNHLTHSKMPNESSSINRYSMTSHRTIPETSNHHLNSFAVAVDDDTFDWDSII